MKIYTKKGDTGTTGLIGGTRISKHAIRIDAYGTVDELNSSIGVVMDHDITENHKTQLREIQDRLFTIGSSLAADPDKSNMKLPDLFEEDVKQLELWMDEMDNDLPEMRFFILPGGHLAISFCHVARCVCRRAERIISELSEREFVAPLVLSYMNRLSDYLFVLSRKISQDLKIEEKPWRPRM
jgi:cob(I)alamin adenosyltransferase